MLIHEKIVNAIDDGSGFFQHGHTYIGHPSSCAAGLATQLEIQERDLLSNVKTQGESLQKALQSAFDTDSLLSDNIGDVRGRGLFIGIELVVDKQSKTTFDPRLKLHAKIKKKAMQNRLMTYPMGGTVDGVNGEHILLAPPFIINEADVQQITQRLSLSITSVLEENR